jgi:hypothetical protein
MPLKFSVLLLVGTTLIPAQARAQTDQPSASRPLPSAGDSAFGASEPVRMSAINFTT